MAKVFPTGFSAIASLRALKLLAANGETLGNTTPADILGLIEVADMYPKLLTADAIYETVASNVTAYSVVVGDKNKTKKFASSGACTVSVPAGLNAGFIMYWKQWGAGVLTFASVSGAGQTIRPNLSGEGLRSAGQYASGALEYLGSNEWHLTGYTQV